MNTTTFATPNHSSRVARVGSRLLGGALALGLCFVAPQASDAFCGFYVAGADAQLFNDATMVVMMRDGKRTVLAMQNDYQGPPENFAMVVPVPVVLSEDNVKILPPGVFERVDKLAAPRLVEYWEQDPCDPYAGIPKPSVRAGGGVPDEPTEDLEGSRQGVVIEAQFTVGEYEVAILSASDSTGLDNWLRANDYQIPPGAEPLLRPYVESGMKFFVAKVDVSKVQFTTQPDGSKRASLSPLRFHYDSDEFALPIRLGMINAPSKPGQQGGGAQDLIIHVLARDTRYQVSNYPNVPIPTNLDVKDKVRDHFGQFYVSLFDHTLEQHPKSVVTEYAWSASTCDPCPEPALTLAELITLGADVLPSYAGQLDGEQAPGNLEWSVPSEFVLTRLHARYDQSSLGEDLVFEEAPGIAGGREHLQSDGKLEQGSVASSANQFQARYSIRHAWEGEVECQNPKRGVWGGPPGDPFGDKRPTVARELATVDRSASLGSFVTTGAGAILGIATPAQTDPAEQSAEQKDKAKPDTKDAKAGDTAPTGDKASPATTPAGEGEKANAGGCRCQLHERQPFGPEGLGFGLLAFIALTGLRRRTADPSAKTP